MANDKLVAVHEVPSQKDLIQRVVLRISLNGGNPVVEVKEALDEALRVDKLVHGGQVFHGSETPRNSARRALYQALDTSVILVKDGHGQVRFKAEALRNAILQGDAWEILKLLPSGVAGCIVADAPHTHLDEHRNIGKATRLTNNDYFRTRDMDAELFTEFARILMPGGYVCAYMPPMQLTSVEIWENVLRAAREAGLVMIRQVTWKKHRTMGYRWTSSTEPVLCWAKPLSGPDAKRPKLPECDDRQATDFIEAATIKGSNRTPYTDWTDADQAKWDAAAIKYGGQGEIPREVRKTLPGRYHDTEKPVEVARHLLRVAKKPGALLVEVFAGTGHACVVAKEFNMDFLALEGNPRTVTRCLAPRLEAAGVRVNAIIEVGP